MWYNSVNVKQLAIPYEISSTETNTVIDVGVISALVGAELVKVSGAISVTNGSAKWEFPILGGWGPSAEWGVQFWLDNSTGYVKLQRPSQLVGYTVDVRIILEYV